MSEANQRHLLAMIDIPVTGQLAEVAAHLTRLLPSFSFELENSGRYEEVPAFVAKCGAMSFALLGIPDGEDGDEYQLEFDCITTQSLEQLAGDKDAQTIGLFVREEKTSNSRGFYDYSQELADLLISLGIPGCKPIIVGD